MLEFVKKHWYILPALIIVYLLMRKAKIFEPIVDTEGGAQIDNAKANQIAESLYNSMQGYGTDWDSIALVLLQLNKADLIMVYNSFGLRKYYFWESGSDLMSWFRYELSGDKLQSMRLLWASAGFTV